MEFSSYRISLFRRIIYYLINFHAAGRESHNRTSSGLLREIIIIFGIAARKGTSILDLRNVEKKSACSSRYQSTSYKNCATSKHRVWLILLFKLAAKLPLELFRLVSHPLLSSLPQANCFAFLSHRLGQRALERLSIIKLKQTASIEVFH